MDNERRQFLKQACWTLLGGGLMVSGALSIPGRAHASGGRQHLYVFLVDTNRCIGCGKCVAACRKENNVPQESYRTWIERYAIGNDGTVHVDSPHGGEHGFKPLPNAADIARSFFVPKLCNHCKQPNCVQVCPVGATYVSKEGFVLVDERQCVGCGYCIQACPYGARYMHAVRHTADKCTWCYHRVMKGMQPACVLVCPVGARMFGRIDDQRSPLYAVMKQEKLQVLKPETGNEPMVHYRGLDKEVR
ncbi:MAG: 4Fe-4S dicluster domain-containing protein [Desulfobacterota bacterium]|nr:4Fe-4S dicluster domain-containing protein [Thermodesulfobacteriota bacterium]